MACMTCAKDKRVLLENKVIGNEIVIESIPQIKTTTVVGYDGKKYTVMAPLLKIEPALGWGVTIRLKTAINVDGKPMEIVEKIKSLCSLNGVEAPSDARIWYALNMEWLSRMPNNVRNAITSLKILETIKA